MSTAGRKGGYMFSGDQIFNALARSKAPAERLTRLDDAGLVRLCELLDGLPAAGVPLILGALVDSEIKTRFSTAVLKLGHS